MEIRRTDIGTSQGEVTCSQMCIREEESSVQVEGRRWISIGRRLIKRKRGNILFHVSVFGKGVGKSLTDC